MKEQEPGESTGGGGGGQPEGRRGRRRGRGRDLPASCLLPRHLQIQTEDEALQDTSLNLRPRL